MFILKEDGSLVPLKSAHFELEVHFQQQLEQHPELLAGELIDPDRPRKWLLIRREMGIPNEVNGSDWWSVDHLFLDQDAVPTIVEVKRQSDTRLRREVVAQMLEYAATGSAFWTVASIRDSFEQSCEKKELEPDQELRLRFGQELDTEDFWQRVKTNLEAKRLRLLFVADVVPPELRRLVEFLNEQMKTVDVLALELKQYVGENGLRTIVPTIFGQTQSTRDVKSTRGRPVGGVVPDRAYWTGRAPAIMPAVDQLVSQALQCGPSIHPNYHQAYIGMSVDGEVCNFVSISPKQKFLRMSLRMARGPEVDQQIAATGVHLIEYRVSPTWSGYRFRLVPADVEKHQELIGEWMRRAYMDRQPESEASVIAITQGDTVLQDD